MESATKGRLPGKGILLSAISSACWYPHLHSAKQHWGNSLSHKDSCWQKLQGILSFSATSCAALPKSPSLHLREMWLPIPVTNWSDPPHLLLTRFEASHSEHGNHEPWERNYTTSIKPDIFPTKPGGGTGIVFYFAARLLKPSSAPKFLRAPVVMDASERKKQPFPQGSWTHSAKMHWYVQT